MKKRKNSLKGSSKAVRKGRNNKASSSLKDDPFFNQPKRRRVIDDDDEEIDEDDFDDSGDSGDERYGAGSGGEEVEEDESEKETADEKRQRVAKAYIDKIRAIARREKEDEEGEGEDEDEKEGGRDSAVADMLQQEQLEESGRVRRLVASRVQKPDIGDSFRILVKHRQSVTAVALADDDSRGFSASKEGTILHWDVSSGKSEKYLWPNEDTLRSHGVKDPQGRVSKHSKSVLALAVSSDGRYLASGGFDHHVHLWDTRTREHIQAFPGHRGPVSCLTFRQGTAELFSGSFDRTIKMWNADDRAYINTLFGHQSKVLTIDCLRKERVLTVGRDRTMQLFKIPEESRIVFRAPASSLECCCFISNDEYLSGSDDGSIELWNIMRKKPVYTAKNAHPYCTSPIDFNAGDNERMPNGHMENGDVIPQRGYQSTVFSWVSAITLCRGSDLVASGAGNGLVRLWAVANESKNIQPLHELPLVGFVNSLAFAKSGNFIIAGVGREPRLGRWGRLQSASNGVAIQSLRLS